MAISDMFNAKQLREENEALKKENFYLKQEITNLKALLSPEHNQIIELKNLIKKLQDQQGFIVSANEKLKNENIQISQIIDAKKSEIIQLDDEILFQSFSLYKPIYDFAKSEQYKDRLEKIREEQKTMIKNKTAVSYFDGWTVDGSKSKGQKMNNDNIKQIIRSFNNECENVIDRVTFANIESMRKRIQSAYDSLNKLNTSTRIALKSEFLALKMQELNLAYEYQIKKQDEKEEQKRIREELREQQKLEKEIKEAREKIEKEKKHFQRAIEEIELKIKTSIDDVEAAKFQEKLTELLVQNEKLNEEEKVIDYREKNAKAGYVYIISNIGAFGDNVYKIGMTRRLEPMDRIDELGDASVPFRFDTHALVFSDNAPDLEAKLHQKFEDRRLNKINNRKEFYNVTIEEIETVIKENYDQTLDVLKIPPAEQYRESLAISKETK